MRKTPEEEGMEPCGCMEELVCPHCDRDYSDGAFDINGDGFHVHSCPFCGVVFKAHLESK